MAAKKSSGKGKSKAPKTGKIKPRQEAALPEPPGMAGEELAVMPDAPAPANEPVPEREVAAGLAANPAGGVEAALPESPGMAGEELVLMPDAPAPANEPVPAGEVAAGLAANPAGGVEAALPEPPGMAGEELAVMPDAPAPANEPVPEREVAAGLEKENAGRLGQPPALDADAAREKAHIGPQGPRLPGGITPRPLFQGNPYLPMVATVMEIIEETHNIRTLRLTLDDEKLKDDFVFEPGQVGQISVFGAGEATFVINSPPSQKHYLQFSVMKTGEVTDAIHQLSVGDKVGLRAPLGNFFPYADWKGKNVFFIGGGIGMAPIRTIMLYLLEHKADYGQISLLYGARSPQDMAYAYELDDWMRNPDLDCTLCIDNPHEQWHHKVGLIPRVLEELNPAPENAVAVLCGPPIMIKFTLQALQKMGFAPENIVTTLEKRMKCGIGICGRCNIGDRYVCVDGPVFTMRELDGLPADY